MFSGLIRKYNVPGPRYTSYPTVPYWDTEDFSVAQWLGSAHFSFAESNDTEGISLYIHLPFCESLCTFCGCHKRITKRHDVEDPYVTALLAEWAMYLKLWGSTPVIKEIHLGGGTPTFFSSENLKRLVDGILKTATIAPQHSFSFEGHPNYTSAHQMATLRSLGFDRVSFGVQEYSPVVQRAIHRIQPYEKVAEVTQNARSLGYASVSHDLVYGLPFQTREDIIQTINKTIPLLPDRISFYSYAHVPWMKGNGQRGFKEEDIPKGEAKRILFETGRALLRELGYEEIGMDHFALRKDALYHAMIHGKLHRNFMGYTASKTQLLVGLGASAISDSWYGFAQNEKSIEVYQDKVLQGEWPVFRGHLLTPEDLVIRRHILNLMCTFQTSWEGPEDRFPNLPDVLFRLREPERDGLLHIEEDRLCITDAGRPFVRNICMAFDLRLQRDQPQTELFSMTI